MIFSLPREEKTLAGCVDSTKGVAVHKTVGVSGVCCGCLGCAVGI